MSVKHVSAYRGIRLAGFAALTAAGLLSGCATPPKAGDAEAQAEYEQTNDPGEPTNRAIFDFNHSVDGAVLKPVAEGYRELPGGLRQGIRNFLTNWTEPLVLVHDLLQGEMGRAGQTVSRFATNTTLGFLGVGDVAGEGLNIQHHDEDMGQTLAVWGVGEGPYIVLPLFGPSNMRDAVGKVADFFMDPMTYLVPVPVAADYSKMAVGGVDKREEFLDALNDVERTSLDYYASLRTLYRQRRAEEISNGKRPLTAPITGITYQIDRQGNDPALVSKD